MCVYPYFLFVVIYKSQLPLLCLPLPLREMMIHAASEQPKDDLPYEEMSEVRARAEPHMKSLAVLLLLNVLLVFVSFRAKRSSLNISRTRSLLTS